MAGNDKEGDKMKVFKKISKILIYIIIVIISFGCGVYVGMFDTVPTSKYNELNQKYSAITAQEDNDTNNNKNTYTTQEMSNRGFTPISFGENVSVETPYGNFEIQIDKVEKTIYDSDGCKSIAIKCIVNNVNYAGSYNQNQLSGYDIAENNNFLQMTDVDGVAYPYYDLSATLDEYALAHDLQIGSKAREAYLFLVPEDAKNVSVVINNKYILNTNI